MNGMHGYYRKSGPARGEALAELVPAQQAAERQQRCVRDHEDGHEDAIANSAHGDHVEHKEADHPSIGHEDGVYGQTATHGEYWLSDP
jgi:hypothetical protein